ncbi:Ribonuclease H1 [Apophysomyces ossiformis]|uniref:Ribonuclease H n=1 Tax=Apophysomyces ossiformis TaxID=679940 RepID=A0A8H7EP42_9FUNG|nr:Ribonuclease H1 [Apophysomyces ossiformis]
MSTKRCYYGVRVGRSRGVFDTWEKCKSLVEGFPGAKYKKFPTYDEAHQFSFPKSETTTQSSQPSAGRKRRADHNEIDTALVLDFLKDKEFGLEDDSAIESVKEVKKLKTAVHSSVINASHDKPPPELILYTDGASSNNGSKGSKAGFGVYWADDHPNNVSERLVGKQTNQRAEASAVIRALEQTLHDPRQLEIRTDSQYVIKAIYDWSRTWKKNNWKSSTGKEVQNRDLFEKLLDLLERRGHRITSIVYVPGHKGIHGNEMADRLACRGATLPMNDKS